MTRTRLKRWCGMHPVLAVNVLTVTVYILAAAGFVVTLHSAEGRRISGGHMSVILIAIVSGMFMTVAVMTHVVTVIVVRAGLPRTSPLGCLKYALLTSGPFYVFTAAVALEFIEGRGMLSNSRNMLSFVGVMLVPATMLVQFLGWASGVLFGRRKVRRGAWEFTRPPSAEWERPTFPVRHPVATMVIVVSGMGFVLGLLNGGFNSLSRRDLDPLSTGFLVLYALLAVSMFSCAFFVTYRRRRFGRPAAPVAFGSLYAAAAGGAMIAGVAALGARTIYSRIRWRSVLELTAAEMTVIAVFGVLGYAASELRYRLAVRRGAWEFARTGDGEHVADSSMQAGPPSPVTDGPPSPSVETQETAE